MDQVAQALCAAVSALTHAVSLLVAELAKPTTDPAAAYQTGQAASSSLRVVDLTKSPAKAEGGDANGPR